MKRLIEFAKIEATGNDFVLLDNRTFGSAPLTAEQVKNICDRRFGIGADGLIRLDSDNQNIRIDYYNSDGSAGTTCGNGLRAALLFAYIQGLLKKEEELCFLASDGEHRVILFSKDRIRVEILSKRNVSIEAAQALDLPDNLRLLGFTNTGVPHLVLETDRPLQEIDLQEIGARLRNHPVFQPEGTNVNIIRKLDDTHLAIRTFERGIEGETLSCGTGVTASALVYLDRYKTDTSRLFFKTKGGELIVEKENDGVFLEGPAHAVFIGQYLLAET